MYMLTKISVFDTTEKKLIKACVKTFFFLITTFTLT